VSSIEVQALNIPQKLTFSFFLLPPYLFLNFLISPVRIAIKPKRHNNKLTTPSRILIKVNLILIHNTTHGNQEMKIGEWGLLPTPHSPLPT
jgi:hypothetical protein